MQASFHILYVDDYRFDRELVREALQEERDFRLTEVSSMAELEAQLSTQEYDLILSDFNILGFEGLQILAFVREKMPQVPVIIVTGTGSEEIAVAAMRQGAADYVVKTPQHIRRLPQTIRSVLEKQRLQAELLQAEEQLRQRQAALQAVYDIATILGNSFTTLCAQVASQLAQLLKVAQVTVYRKEGTESTVMAQITHGQLRQEEATAFQEASWAFVATVPIQSHRGEQLGRIELRDEQARILSAEDFQLVQIFTWYIGYEIERRALDSQLQEAHSMQMIGQLAAGVAHEVRNPLNAILANVEALAQEIEERQEYQPYFSHIRTQIDRLSHLMQDLLALGRPIQPSRFQPEPLPVICAAAIELWKQSLSQQRHVVHLLQSTGGASVLVNVESSRLQQVFFNLLDNAAQHSPAGSEIRVIILEPTAGMVRVQISDQGTGITPEHLRQVFDPFFTTRTHGTGLGLTLVKRIVESHGGRVTIWNNTPLSGCTVEVRLPVIEETSDETTHSARG